MLHDLVLGLDIIKASTVLISSPARQSPAAPLRPAAHAAQSSLATQPRPLLGTQARGTHPDTSQADSQLRSGGQAAQLPVARTAQGGQPAAGSQRLSSSQQLQHSDTNALPWQRSREPIQHQRISGAHSNTLTSAPQHQTSLGPSAPEHAPTAPSARRPLQLPAAPRPLLPHIRPQHSASPAPARLLRGTAPAPAAAASMQPASRLAAQASGPPADVHMAEPQQPAARPGVRSLLSSKARAPLAPAAGQPSAAQPGSAAPAASNSSRCSSLEGVRLSADLAARLARMRPQAASQLLSQPPVPLSVPRPLQAQPAQHPASHAHAELQPLPRSHSPSQQAGAATAEETMPLAARVQRLQPKHAEHAVQSSDGAAQRPDQQLHEPAAGLISSRKRLLSPADTCAAGAPVQPAKQARTASNAKVRACHAICKLEHKRMMLVQLRARLRT